MNDECKIIDHYLIGGGEIWVSAVSPMAKCDPQNRDYTVKPPWSRVANMGELVIIDSGNG